MNDTEKFEEACKTRNRIMEETNDRITADEPLRAAIRLHQNGCMVEAKKAFEEILKQNPRHHTALHHLGVILFTHGHMPIGEKLILKAIGLNPGKEDYYTHLSKLYWDFGRKCEAEAFARRGAYLSSSSLNKTVLFKPEIRNDELYGLILNLAGDEKLEHILEIGSATGEGSTEAFVRGIKSNPYTPVLYCLELLPGNFASLKSRYADCDRVKCYNMSAVPVESFPEPEEIEEFYRSVKSSMNDYPLATVLMWLKKEIATVTESGLPQNGIEYIKTDNRIETFDMVLIDGSEFAAQSEMAQIYGAGWIILDDVCSYKNYHNRLKLLSDPAYELFRENLLLRNGYSAFRKNAGIS